MYLSEKLFINAPPQHTIEPHFQATRQPGNKIRKKTAERIFFVKKI
jgi:hypothetical protein